MAALAHLDAVNDTALLLEYEARWQRFAVGKNRELSQIVERFERDRKALSTVS